ncbi:hypothetical protein TVAG_102320 [Trichomonas vaginalis G3]|uniref:DUF3447 domain-containing protein n=1 Tax=Trichomonas vaginalis (strain ATCC PRA-98 / G3) TaxID=412133 RepID=A2ECT8_TRIV3|nr:protein ubiquitination [Trichomonas vaginalis G3]EAY09483.1 hypothetical protein TVAG_102320 [Trichomonas vaginalis G3]KAI5521414.1 protein ubiquitination [Trichomonas vaginalis G3]|eukprot:XP_001321706.1 hypothetical protein [Trichomonas vaginalis G3]
MGSTMQANLHDEIMKQFGDYDNVYSQLYRLKSFDEEIIDELFQDINKILIVTKIDLPVQLLSKISIMAAYNNRYLRSYWTLFKKIYSKYNPKPANFLSSIFKYLFYREYNKYWDEESKEAVERYQSDEFSSFLIGDDLYHYTIYHAIVNDDLNILIPITEEDYFDKDQMITTGFFPFSSCGYFLLELCSYYGSVNCFKFFLTKFNPRITQKCLQFSFLGGNKEIISECLKNKQPDKETMKSAIISHNVDFVTYLMNEHKLNIDVEYCCKFNNLQAFAVYLDESEDININNCFIYSPWFGIPDLCVYLIEHGADVNTKDGRKNNAFFKAQDPLTIQTMEVLLNNGIDYKAVDWRGQTILHVFVARNMYEQAKLLLEKCQDINVNAVDKYKITPLLASAARGSPEIIELLLSHGANVNAQDVSGETALEKAMSTSNLEVIKLLISHGAYVNIQDDYGKTALQIAAQKNCKEVIEFLTSQGINFNE